MKDQIGAEAVAIGTDTAGPELWNILGKWADKIFVCGELGLMKKVPEKFWGKTVHLNIGRDVWRSPTHPDLLKQLKAKIMEKSNTGNF